MAKPKLGSGARFAALKNKLSHQEGIHNPGALAASIGRKKYGAAKMAKMAAKGRTYDEGGVVAPEKCTGHWEINGTDKKFVTE